MRVLENPTKAASLHPACMHRTRSDRGNGWPSERALSRHGLRGERLAAGWAGLAITKSNTAREALACFGTPDDLLIAVCQGFLTQGLVGSFAGRLNTLG